MDERTLQALLKPDAYDDHPGEVSLRQTHVSYIFITDHYVYKVKKPVDFGFLNFTTIDRRRFYCEEEVRLNRRLSPDMYLGVVELHESSTGGSFTGSGPVIDYAVKMLRLPDEFMLDRLVGEDRVVPVDMLRLAETVAAFHLRADRDFDQSGSLAAVRQNWDDNFRLASSFVGRSLSMEHFDLLRQWVDQFFATSSSLFEQRIADGFVRDCDGDLHLANICMGEMIRIFDCIEFNDRFRRIDTASDIAFLLMDLDFHGRSDLGVVFLEEYCRLTGDCECPRLVDFYKVYRAFVRGKIAGLKMLDAAIPVAEREAALETSIRYFRLAAGYILRTSMSQSLIMISGLPGSGKSTLARQLGIELGLDVLSSDRIRKGLYSPDTGGSPASRSDLYTAASDTATYDELQRQAFDLLGTGRSVIVDATFRRQADRDRFRECAAAAGVSLVLVMAAAPERTVLQRLEARQTHPDRYSDAGVAVYHSLAESFQYPDPDIEPFIPVDTSLPPWLGADAVLSALGVVQ